MANSNVQNSISELLDRLQAMFNNNTDLLNLLLSIVRDESNIITQEVVDLDGNTQTITFNSFRNITNRQSQLEESIRSITGLGASGKGIIIDSAQNPSEIFVSNFKEATDKIEGVGGDVANFNTKPNYFFEEFSNPSLFFDLDLTGKIDNDVERVKVVKYIIESDTLWDEASTTINSPADFINYTENVDYVVDENIYDIKTSQKRFFGDFDVLKVDVDDNSDFLLTVSSLNYNDRLNPEIGSRSLSSGDILITPDGSSKFEVLTTDKPTLQVTLRRVAGFTFIESGIGKLSFVDSTANERKIEVGISIDQRLLVFVAAINPRTNLYGEYSDQIRLYTNDLIITTEDEGDINFNDYYFSRVVDFGKYIENLAKESSPPLTLGIQPDAPNLVEGNFDVIVDNEHLTTEIEFETVKRLSSERTTKESEIREIDKQIARLKDELYNTTFRTDTERLSVQNKLNATNSSRQRQQESLNSTLEQIRAATESLNLITPIYKVIGFWAIQEPIESPITKPQEIVGYRVQYRKKNVSGTKTKTNNIDFVDGESTRRGSFSDWKELPTRFRKKSLDSSGNIVWDSVDTENADEVNINQLEIEIVKGELVEIRIKAISEAGYPISPLESDWSEVVSIPFPESLNETNNVASIIEDAREKLSEQKAQDLISSLALDQHVSDQYQESSGGRLFKHVADSIDSQFKTPEQNPISLYDKLVELSNRLETVENIVNNRALGFSVSVIDNDGNEIVSGNLQTSEIFAGFYLDEVGNLQNSSGAIVTKQYYVKITNDSASSLDIFSISAGDRSLEVSPPNAAPFGKAPILTLNPDNGISPPFGNSQRNGQIFYIRDTDLANSTDLFLEDGTGEPDNIFDAFITNTYDPSNPHADGTFPAQEQTIVVYNTQDGELQAKKPSLTQRDFLTLSTEHPLYLEYVDTATTPTRKAEIITLVQELANSKSSTVDLVQQGLTYVGGNPTNSRVYPKASFEQDDRFLAGERSCGAYAFVNTSNISDFQVNGNRVDSQREIPSKGEILIPITFQYRMTDTEGLVGGSLVTTDQLVYKKKIGIEIKLSYQMNFSIDLEFTARYRNKSLT